MGTTASAISRLESDQPGNPTFGTLDRYSRAVGAELLMAVRAVGASAGVGRAEAAAGIGLGRIR